MATTRSRLPGVAPTPATLGLAVGDATLIAAFVVAGELRHYPLELALSRTPGTLAPFLLGWGVAGVLAGLYGDAPHAARGVAGRTAAAWIGATVIAMALRATAAFQGDADPTFALVAVAVGLALLVPWRVGATVLRGR